MSRYNTVNIFINNTQLNIYQLISNTIGLGTLLILFSSVYLIISPMLFQDISLIKYISKTRVIFGFFIIFLYIMIVFISNLFG